MQLQTINFKNKVQAFTKDLLNLAIFLSHTVAGYMLHDSSNVITSAVGVFLLILAMIQLLNISFRSLNNM